VSLGLQMGPHIGASRRSGNTAMALRDGNVSTILAGRQ
jgi:hypothetical protein